MAAVESMHLNWISVDINVTYNEFGVADRSVLAQGMLPICIGANLGRAAGCRGWSRCVHRIV